MYKRQNYIQKIEPFIDKPLIKVITGMRRVGKSTILQLLIANLHEKGVSEEQILSINMESFSNRQYVDANILYDFVKTHKNHCSGRLYLFIDEVQEISAWEKLVNSFLADDDADIFITGSNSRLLSGELASLLAGRYVEFVIYPLSFSEFIEFRGGTGEDREKRFQEYLEFGGLPGIHSLEYETNVIYQYLNSIRDSVMLKDIVMRNKIRDVALLEKIIQFIADNIGNIFSAHSIADYFKKEKRSVSVETIYNYIGYLETAFLIQKAPRYDLKGKKILETNEKYYINDLGLRHALIGFRSSDINDFLENIIYFELKTRGYKVMVGKMGEFEVDFICEKQGEKLYIQVCYLMPDESVRKRELRPLLKIKDNHPKYVLSMDRLPQDNYEGIIRMYIPDFLLP